MKYSSLRKISADCMFVGFMGITNNELISVYVHLEDTGLHCIFNVSRLFSHVEYGLA